MFEAALAAQRTAGGKEQADDGVKQHSTCFKLYQSVRSLKKRDKKKEKKERRYATLSAAFEAHRQKTLDQGCDERNSTQFADESAAASTTTAGPSPPAASVASSAGCDAASAIIASTSAIGEGSATAAASSLPPSTTLPQSTTATTCSIEGDYLLQQRQDNHPNDVELSSVEHNRPTSVTSPAAQASTIVYRQLVTRQELHALLCQLSQSTSSIHSRLK